MQKKDIVIGLIVLAVLAGVVYLVRRPKDELRVTSTPSVEEKMEDAFNLEIPADAE